VTTALEVASAVRDPELPVLTLADLGVLREVSEEDGRVVVTITPTYSGCPAIDEMGADLRRSLVSAGFSDVEVRLSLSTAWTTDWISSEGRAKLAAAGIAGPVPLNLVPPSRQVACPQCGSLNTSEISRFGSTACKALRRCNACSEPFEHVKEI
jgi:ring-1,2-phenylacetyl-CoA epoxidase subunit PaaD